MSQEPQDCRRATLGRVADLVLLRANPLSDIRATREIEAVESATREDGDGAQVANHGDDCCAPRGSAANRPATNRTLRIIYFPIPRRVGGMRLRCFKLSGRQSSFGSGRNLANTCKNSLWVLVELVHAVISRLTFSRVAAEGLRSRFAARVIRFHSLFWQARETRTQQSLRMCRRDQRRQS